MPLWPALLLAAVAARAADPAPPPPPVSLTVQDDLGEAAYRPRWSLLGDKLLIAPVVKAGALALTENFPYPYPILKQSPFAEGGVKLAYHGAVDVMAVATVGYVNLRSHRLFDDPNGALGSTASDHPGTDISQHQLVQSTYLDVGKSFDVGSGWKGALYAAFDQFSISAAHPDPGNFQSDGLAEGSVGTSWLHRSKVGNELSLWAEAAGEGAPRDFYRNDGHYSVAPSARGGLEYSFLRPGGERWLVGTDLQASRADDAIRPYVGWQDDSLKAIIGAEWRKSNNQFYPDVRAISASVEGRVSKDLSLGLSARYVSSSYAMAPAPDGDTRVMATLTWTPSASAVIKTAKSWGASRRPASYDPDADKKLNAQITDDQRAGIRQVITQSPTLGQFLKSYKAGSSLDVLAALSEFTSLFSQYNYNYHEGDPPNLDSLDQLYQHARQSYLSGNSDPTLVCLGAAQYAAAVAQMIGQQSGIPIQATAVTVQVPAASGNASGHAVAAVKTKDYGIVFVDWGRLIPTYTWDTERALRVYQALIGVPAMFHEITDAGQNGRHVGYLFTEEGKLYVNNLTFHDEMNKSVPAQLFDDDPRGDAAAAQRWKDLLRDGQPR